MRFKLPTVFLAVLAVVGIAGTVPVSANEEIIERSENHDLWAAPGQNMELHRYSKLGDINAENVKGLQLSWAQSTGALRGHEGQPVVVEIDGKPMMYFVSAWPNIVQALDLSNPDKPVQIWNYEKKTDRDESAVPRACCDVVHRGLNYVDGKVIVHTLDGFIISLDARTGEENWVRQARLSGTGRDPYRPDAGRREPM